MKTQGLLLLTILILVQTNSKCAIDKQIPIDLGKDAVICLHVYNGANYIKTFPFKVSVDYFEALSINGLAKHINDTISTYSQVSIKVQFQNSEGKQQTIQIWNKNDKRYRDVLSFIVLISEGKFTQIRLDNSKCDALGGDDICHMDESYTRTPSDNKFGTKDPKFFISWMGSDINKNNCISHTRRLSRFSSFSVGSIYSAAKNIATN